MNKKLLIIIGVLFSVSLLLGAGPSVARQAKTKWNNWANRNSAGVSLSCPDKNHAIKFYHKERQFSSISIDGPGSRGDTVAIYVDHKTNAPKMQVVDPSNGRIYQISLVALARHLEAQHEDELPWGGTAGATSVEKDSVSPIISSGEKNIDE